MSSPPLAKVGKTSLIMSLVGEEFPEEVSVNTAIHHCCVSYLKSCLLEDASLNKTNSIDGNLRD